MSDAKIYPLPTLQLMLLKLLRQIKQMKIDASSIETNSWYRGLKHTKFMRLADIVLDILGLLS